LYQNLDKRADTIMDLLDALSGNRDARSVVELSEHSLFRRGYANIYYGIRSFHVPAAVQRQAVAQATPRPQKRPFWLMAVDVTHQPRPYARTMADRSYVHAPAKVPGQKPVTIGHAYSSVVILPERSREMPPWVIPADVRRVPSEDDPELTGAAQIDALLQDEKMPWHGNLVATVADTAYSKPAFLLYEWEKHPNWVRIVRVRSNRVFYRQPEPASGPRRPGHPRWYGDKFDLKDAATWHPPDEEFQWEEVHDGKTVRVRVRIWENMLMRGSREYAMHRYPFTLIRVERLNDRGEPLHRGSLWLILFGPHRDEIPPQQAAQSYFQRFDEEHFFRFSKQHLLLTAFQSPDVTAEEHWWQIVAWAYLFLWLARPLAQQHWRPWEKYLARTPYLSPSHVQRDYARIIAEIGTPARLPKPRGMAPGRPKGYHPPRRLRHSVVRKGKKPSQKAA
jgi:hypothetical protein